MRMPARTPLRSLGSSASVVLDAAAGKEAAGWDGAFCACGRSGRWLFGVGIWSLGFVMLAVLLVCESFRFFVFRFSFRSFGSRVLAMFVVGRGREHRGEIGRSM